jgi:(p)ppGpp synthase/HD superfamily hydrolase
MNPSKRCFSVRFSFALAFAEELHAYQRQSGSDMAFSGHLLGVAGAVIDHQGDEDEAISALLHDAVENQGGATTLWRITDKFGSRVGGIVESLSESLVVPNHARSGWMDRKRAYLAYLRDCIDRSVYLVLAADLQHTARVISEEYRRSGERYWQRFNSGKPGQVWYMEDLAAILQAGPKDARRAPLVQETAEAIERFKKDGSGYMSISTLA